MLLEKSIGHSSQVPDDSANRFFLGFDTLGELELDERSPKNVLSVSDLKVDISFEIFSK